MGLGFRMIPEVCGCLRKEIQAGDLVGLSEMFATKSAYMRVILAKSAYLKRFLTL